MRPVSITTWPKLGCSPDSLRIWCQKSERDAGARSGLSSADKDRLKALERENKELRTANELLKKASAYFARAELDRRYYQYNDCKHQIDSVFLA